MQLNKNPELKSAILNLPQNEKDKLMLRLINRDSVLTNQLHFQLLEDDLDLEERREKVLKSIEAAFKKIDQQMQYDSYYNARFFTTDLRSISGHVNEHVLITKDKLGELELRLHILSKAFQFARSFFLGTNYNNEKLLIYITGRIKNVFGQYQKLHEDLQFDFREKLNKILGFAYSSALKPYLIELEIPHEV